MVYWSLFITLSCIHLWCIHVLIWKLVSIKTYPSLSSSSLTSILSSCSYLHHHYGPCVVFFRHITSQWQVRNMQIYIYICQYYILIIERQRSCSLWIWIVLIVVFVLSLFSLKSKVLERFSISITLVLCPLYFPLSHLCPLHIIIVIVFWSIIETSSQNSFLWFALIWVSTRRRWNCCQTYRRTQSRCVFKWNLLLSKFNRYQTLCLG